jgi:hypothetical protein
VIKVYRENLRIGILKHLKGQIIWVENSSCNSCNNGAKKKQQQ